MKKFLYIVIVLIIIILVILGFSNQSGGQIKVGAVIPLTGTGAYWGEASERGILLAQEDINKKYGQGAFKIIIEDGRSVAPDSVAAAQKLLSVNKVDAIYTEFSGPSSAIAPITKEAGKLYFYGAFNPVIVSENSNSLKGFLSFADPCDSFGKYLKTKGADKVAVFNQFAGVAPSCIDMLVKYIPKENILLFENLPKDNDYRSILLQVKNFKADAIIGMTYEGPALSWIKQMRDMNISIPVYSGYEDALTQKVIDTIGINNLKGSAYFASKVDKSFAEKYKQKYPDRSPADLEAAAYAYEAMVNLAETMIPCDGKVDCTVKSFENRVSDAGAISDAKFVNRILSSSLDYYLIDAGTTTPLSITHE